MRREERAERNLQDLRISMKNISKLNRSPYFNEEMGKDEEALLDMNEDLKIIGATALQEAEDNQFLGIRSYYDYVRSVSNELRRPRLEKLVALRMRDEVRNRFDSHKQNEAKVLRSYTAMFKMISRADKSLEKELGKELDKMRD